MPKFVCECGASYSLTDDDFNRRSGTPFACAECGTTRLLQPWFVHQATASPSTAEPSRSAPIIHALSPNLADRRSSSEQGAAGPATFRTVLSVGSLLLGAVVGRKVRPISARAEILPSEATTVRHDRFVSVGADQREIVARVTHAHVDDARNAAAQLARELTALEEKNREIRAEIAATKRQLWWRTSVAILFRLILRIRARSARLAVWPAGAFIIASAASAALAIAGTTFLTNDALAWAVGGVFGAVLGGLTCATVLFVPERFLAVPHTHDLELILRAAERRNGDADTQRARVQVCHDTALAEYRRLKAITESRLYALLACDWRTLRGIPFEDFLADVFQELGFEVERTKATGDQGVDLIATRGGRRLAIQAKGYAESVGNSAVQEVVTGKIFYRCHACAVITNSGFTSGAIELAVRTNCTLVEGRQLRDLIMGRISFG